MKFCSEFTLVLHQFHLKLKSIKKVPTISSITQALVEEKVSASKPFTTTMSKFMLALLCNYRSAGNFSLIFVAFVDRPAFVKNELR